MATPVHFDSRVGEQFLRYARLVAGRGYIHNTLGNMAIRAPHPDHAHGVAYTKHAEISLEEMGVENIVITEIATSRLLYGTRMTSVGHNLNREILRLRPDIGAVIHVHDDATIAFFGSGAFREVKVLSLDMPFILGKPPYYVPASVDVEADVGPVKAFIESGSSARARRHVAGTHDLGGLPPSQLVHGRGAPQYRGRASGSAQGDAAALSQRGRDRADAQACGGDHLSNARREGHEGGEGGLT
jgi:hypothetical protein